MLYRIEMMSKNDYHNYMTGGYNYSVRSIDIEANTAEEALEIAKKNNPYMVFNESYVRTVAELEELEAKRNAEYKAQLKAKAEKADKAKARKAKAEALGLTVEEYKAKVKHDKKVRDAEARIAELKAELAKEEKYLEELKKGVDKPNHP